MRGHALSASGCCSSSRVSDCIDRRTGELDTHLLHTFLDSFSFSLAWSTSRARHWVCHRMHFDNVMAPCWGHADQRVTPLAQ